MDVTSSVKPRKALFRASFGLGGPPHCMRSHLDGKWYVSGTDHECLKWRGHPYARGKTGFLRFIHALPDQLHNTDLMNPFLPDRRERIDDPDEFDQTFLWICHEGQPLGDRLVYAEVYLLKDSRGTNPVFKVFLDRDDQCLATIECYDERYVEPSRMAAAAVAQQYKDEEAA